MSEEDGSQSECFEGPLPRVADIEQHRKPAAAMAHDRQKARRGASMLIEKEAEIEYPLPSQRLNAAAMSDSDSDAQNDEGLDIIAPSLAPLVPHRRKGRSSSMIGGMVRRMGVRSNSRIQLHGILQHQHSLTSVSVFNERTSMTNSDTDTDPGSIDIKTDRLNSIDSDSDDDHDILNHELKADAQELFFDLIFVAMVSILNLLPSTTLVLLIEAIRLATFLKENFGWDALLASSLLFCSFWLTWYHVNMMKTRFTLPFPANLGIFFIMLFTLATAIQNTSDQGPGYYDTRFVVMTTLNRLVFLVMYKMIWTHEPRSRAVVSRYLACFVLSLILTASACGTNNKSTRLNLILASVAVELLMYPFSVYHVPNTHHIGVVVGHHLERTELWVILILGESIIAMATVTSFVRDVNFYGTACCSFFVVHSMMQLFVHSQPLHHSGFDTHAYELTQVRALWFNFCQLLITLGLFGMAVGLKFIFAYGVGSDRGAWKQEYGLLFSVSCGWAVFWLQVSRYCHEWANRGYSPAKRHLIWGCNALVALGMAACGLLVSSEPSRRQRSIIDDSANIAHVSPWNSILSHGPGWLAQYCRELLDSGSLNAELVERYRRGGSQSAGHSGYVMTGLSSSEFLGCISALIVLLYIAELNLLPTDEAKLDFADYKGNIAEALWGKDDVQARVVDDEILIADDERESEAALAEIFANTSDLNESMLSSAVSVNHRRKSSIARNENLVSSKSTEKPNDRRRSSVARQLCVTNGGYMGAGRPSHYRESKIMSNPIRFSRVSASSASTATISPGDLLSKISAIFKSDTAPQSELGENTKWGAAVRKLRTRRVGPEISSGCDSASFDTTLPIKSKIREQEHESEILSLNEETEPIEHNCNHYTKSKLLAVSEV